MLEIFDEFEQLLHFPNEYPEFRYDHCKCKWIINTHGVLFKSLRLEIDENNLPTNGEREYHKYDQMFATDWRSFTRLVYSYPQCREILLNWFENFHIGKGQT